MSLNNDHIISIEHSPLNPLPSITYTSTIRLSYRNVPDKSLTPFREEWIKHAPVPFYQVLVRVGIRYSRVPASSLSEENNRASVFKPNRLEIRRHARKRQPKCRRIWYVELP